MHGCEHSPGVCADNMLKLMPMQGNAKSLYMLTDGDIKKLGSLAKVNPQNK